MSFGYWMDKPKTKDITGEQIQAGPPLTSRRRRLSGKKTEAPDTHAKNFSRGSPGALFIEWAERPQSHKDSSRMSCLSLLDGQDKDKGHTRRADSGRRQRSPIGAGDCPERKQKRRIPMPKTFPGEALEPYSLNGQSGSSHTKTAPECRVFRYWMDKTRTKDINRRADSGRPHCSPVRSGNCPERKQKHRIPMPKTFPGKAPELLFWLSTQANLLKMAVN